MENALLACLLQAENWKGSSALATLIASDNLAMNGFLHSDTHSDTSQLAHLVHFLVLAGVETRRGRRSSDVHAGFVVQADMEVERSILHSNCESLVRTVDVGRWR